MSMTRERFFECSFTSGGQRRTEYVRAWSAAAAKRVVAEQLASEGIDVSEIEAVLAGRPQRAANSAIPLEAVRASHP